MKNKRYLLALGGLAAALTACSSEFTRPGLAAGGAGNTGESGGPSAGTAGTGAVAGVGNSGPTGGSSGSGSGGTDSTAGAAGGPGPTCIPGVPDTSQVQRMRNRQYDAVMKHLLGVTSLVANGNNPPSFDLVADSEGSLTGIAWNAYQMVADRIAAEVMAGPNKSRFITCEPAMAECLTKTIREFGRKAFRRPLSEDEVKSFERLKDLVATPEQIAEAVLFAFLTSPSFITLPELLQEQDPATGAIKLSAHETATRLSFLLWDSVPDELLNTAADNGLLVTKAQILEQAKRMVLDRERTAPVVAAFHRAYADIRPGSHWADTEHDATKYPKYTPAMVEPMMLEIDRFFEDVAFQRGSFKDLFLSKVAYVNRDTAAIYGLDPSIYGTELTRVELNEQERPGFLTRVGFLSSYSSAAATSPILRGAYIATKILGVHIDDPPPEASKTPVPDGVYTTQRQIVEALTAGGKCVGCHAITINPSGFVLERYDSIGGWQDLDPLTGAIDGTAEVQFSEGNIKMITSPFELMTELVTGPDAKRRYADQWVTFATKRVANPSDVCMTNTLATRLSEDGYTILDVLADLTQADSFHLRTVGN